MVLYFSSIVVSPPVMIYMGEDKYVNEDLLKYGFPEDYWFHVDKLSSAHVYLRQAFILSSLSALPAYLCIYVCQLCSLSV